MAQTLWVDEFPAPLASAFEQKRQGDVIGAKQAHFQPVDMRGIRRSQVGCIYEIEIQDALRNVDLASF